MVFYGSCFEPAVIDRSLKREPGPPACRPMATTTRHRDDRLDQLTKGPYLLGERFSAADVLWGGALG